MDGNIAIVEYWFSNSILYKNNYHIKMEPVPDQANKKANSEHSPELDQPGHHGPELSADNGYDHQNNQRNLLKI